MLYFVVDGSVDDLAVDAELLEYIVGNILALVHDTGEDVYRLNGLLTIALGVVYGALYCFLGFNCKLVKCHNLFLL